MSKNSGSSNPPIRAGVNKPLSFLARIVRDAKSTGLSPNQTSNAWQSAEAPKLTGANENVISGDTPKRLKTDLTKNDSLTTQSVSEDSLHESSVKQNDTLEIADQRQNNALINKYNSDSTLASSELQLQSNNLRDNHFDVSENQPESPQKVNTVLDLSTEEGGLTPSQEPSMIQSVDDSSFIQKQEQQSESNEEIASYQISQADTSQNHIADVNESHVKSRDANVIDDSPFKLSNEENSSAQLNKNTRADKQESDALYQTPTRKLTNQLGQIKTTKSVVKSQRRNKSEDNNKTETNQNAKNNDANVKVISKSGDNAFKDQTTSNVLQRELEGAQYQGKANSEDPSELSLDALNTKPSLSDKFDSDKESTIKRALAENFQVANNQGPPKDLIKESTNTAKEFISPDSTSAPLSQQLPKGNLTQASAVRSNDLNRVKKERIPSSINIESIDVIVEAPAPENKTRRPSASALQSEIAESSNYLRKL